MKQHLPSLATKTADEDDGEDDDDDVEPIIFSKSSSLEAKVSGLYIFAQYMIQLILDG
jgi:hypothetical protein